MFQSIHKFSTTEPKNAITKDTFDCIAEKVKTIDSTIKPKEQRKFRPDVKDVRVRLLITCTFQVLVEVLVSAVT